MVDSRYTQEQLAEFDRRGRLAEYEANRQKLQNQKFDRVGAKEIRKMDMAKYEANRQKLQNQKFDRVGKKEIEKMESKPPFPPGGSEISAKYGDPQAYRYCDHPRPGSIYRLADIPALVRGPTVVLLPSGKEIEVPRMARRDIQARADIHAAVQGQGKLQDLLKMLAGKQEPVAPAGFKMGRAPSFQRARDHPRQNPQLASHQGMNLAF